MMDSDLRKLQFDDYGLVHGNRPENSWLSPGQDYRLMLIIDSCRSGASPGGGEEFDLIYAQTFPGGRGWRCRPTVKDLLQQAEESAPDHLSKEGPIVLPVHIVETRPS